MCDYESILSEQLNIVTDFGNSIITYYKKYIYNN